MPLERARGTRSSALLRPARGEVTCVVRYLRSAVTQLDCDSQARQGLFHAVAELRDSDRLSAAELGRLDELRAWFRGRLPVPVRIERGQNVRASRDIPPHLRREGCRLDASSLLTRRRGRTTFIQTSVASAIALPATSMQSYASVRGRDLYKLSTRRRDALGGAAV